MHTSYAPIQQHSARTLQAQCAAGKHLQQWMRNSCRLTRHAHTATAIAVQACGARAAHSTCGPSLPCLRDMQARSVLYASWQARRHRLARPQLCASAQAQAHAHHLCSCISSRRCRRAAGLLAANGVALYVRKAVAIPPQMRVCGHCCTMRKHKLAATFHALRALRDTAPARPYRAHHVRLSCRLRQPRGAYVCIVKSWQMRSCSATPTTIHSVQQRTCYSATLHHDSKHATIASDTSLRRQACALPVLLRSQHACSALTHKPRYAPGCTARARHQLRTQASAARAAAAARRCTADLCRCCLLAHM